MRIISIEIGQAKLPGCMDTYDAIGLTDEYEEIGLYQNHRTLTWYHNGTQGIFVDSEKL